MKCPNCHLTIPTTVQFCAYCGFRTGRPPGSRRKSRRGCGCLIIILAIISAAVIVWALYDSPDGLRFRSALSDALNVLELPSSLNPFPKPTITPPRTPIPAVAPTSAGANAYRQTGAHFNGGATSNAHIHPNCDSQSNAHSHAGANPDRRPNHNSGTHVHAGSNANSHSSPNGDTCTNMDSVAYLNPYSNTKAYRNAKAHANSTGTLQ